MAYRVLLASLAFYAVASPALAQSCGSAPIAPALPTAAEMAQKTPAAATAAKHDAFAEVKNWQGDLKTYRDCLNGMVNQDKRQLEGLDPKKDADKIARLQTDGKAANHAYDATVDMEEKVVNEFHAIQASFCARKDVDKSSCPK
ncbi:MAG TPA: hypothetical protein VLC74_01710 [Rhizomicrobium sp.]|nr:hypothetical protein [Rhizomicrobium sp.]